MQFLCGLLLILNGGLGSSELAQLPRRAVDLAAAVISNPRGKTSRDGREVNHVVPLWPETVAILRAVLAQRPDDPLLFRTSKGTPWAYQRAVLAGERLTKRLAPDNFNAHYKIVAASAGLRIPGQGFYKLKHLHSTIADQAKDLSASYALAGHTLPGSRGHYVEVGRDRVHAVAWFIRERLGIPEASRGYETLAGVVAEPQTAAGGRPDRSRESGHACAGG